MISPWQISLLVLLVAVLIGTGPLGAYDIPGFPPDRTEIYKETTDSGGNPVSLTLAIFNPPGHRPEDQRPVVVFFFGGGWNSGSPGQFHPHCDYLASRGLVAISAQYRVRNVHGTSPRECIKDGKSAIRWIRGNATSLGIDPDRVVAGGGSAGGHVAAATGTLTSFDEPDENPAVSSRPNALVLFNPVYDNGPGGYGHSRVSAYWEDFSPLHNIDSQTPPAIVFLGTDDHLIPVATAENFQSLMEAEGIRSDLHLYHEQPHSFFNYDLPDDTRGPYDGYQDTVLKMDRFLVSLGYLPDLPDNARPLGGWVSLWGDSGFANGSETTSSPTLPQAGGEVIAAAFPAVDLADGDFIRVTGRVRCELPLTGRTLQLGFFEADNPVSPGTGSGYRGVSLAVPATTDTQLVSNDGSATAHPFEGPGATPLGPMPGSGSPLPAGSTLDFSFMIARNGERYDITVDLNDGGGFRSSQNLLDQTLNPHPHRFDRFSFFLGEELNDSLVVFSDLTLSNGRLRSLRDPLSPTPPSGRPITYLDATEGEGGNTRASGAPSDDLSWLLDPGSSASNQTQWGKRPFGNGATLFQAAHSLPDTLPELTSRIEGLADGTYDIWAFYWDQIDSSTQNWTLSAGLTSGDLTSFSSPGEPAVTGATTTAVTRATELAFTDEVLVIDGDGLRNLFGVNLGRRVVSGGESVEVFIDNLLGNGSGNRTWFDGVGYAKVNDYQSWISGFSLGEESAPSDDPDRDGIANALENFYGTDPGFPDHPGITLAPAGPANEFTFRHPKNPNVADDLSARYQWSENLARFHENGIPDQKGTVVTFSSSPDPSSPGLTIVTATRNGPSSSAPLFLRIAIEIPSL